MAAKTKRILASVNIDRVKIVICYQQESSGLSQIEKYEFTGVNNHFKRKHNVEVELY
jgi:hypothetical protein